MPTRQLWIVLFFLGVTAQVRSQVGESEALYNATVAVWSELGHGTGVVVDKRGIVLTSQRLVGASQIVSVQFDPTHKVHAVVLAGDDQKDIAVLWTNLAPCPNCVAAQIPAGADAKTAGVAVGDKIIAVSSPMGPLKQTTSGTVSAVDSGNIASDIQTDPWTAGGPVFNGQGALIGLTSAAGQTNPGHGPSRIVPITQASPLIEQAQAKLAGATIPSATLLPVETADVFPHDALERSSEVKKFDFWSYRLGEGDYEVTLVTPILIYRTRADIKASDEKRQAKHKDRPIEPTPDITEMWGLKNWSPYLAEYTPVLVITAQSFLQETKGSLLGRALTGAVYSEPWKMKFKTDFSNMKLKCGEREIEPIQSGKIVEGGDEDPHHTRVTNTSSMGFYSYPPDAISPSCGQVTLELDSLKNPDKPTIKVLNEKVVNKIWADFEPYRKSTAATANAK